MRGQHGQTRSRRARVPSRLLPTTRPCLHAHLLAGLFTLPHTNRPSPIAHRLQVREIWLSSEDTGAYGRDIGTSLPALLHQLVEVLPPGLCVWLSVG